MFRVFLCIRMKHHVVVHVEIRLVQVEQDPIVVTGRVAEMEKENEKIVMKTKKEQEEKTLSVDRKTGKPIKLENKNVLTKILEFTYYIMR